MSLLQKVLPFVGAVLSATPLAPLVGVVNALLPGNVSALPVDATGQQVIDAYHTLPPGRQAQADAHVLAMEQQHTAQFSAMVAADASGNTNRPQIVLMYARVTAFTVASFVVFMFYVVWGLNGEALANALAELGKMWQLFAGVLGILSTPILKYFNDRSKDKAARYAAGSGGTPPMTGLIGMVKNFIN